MTLWQPVLNVCVSLVCELNSTHPFLSVLLEQELVKHTHDAADKSNLKIALDAMKVSAVLNINGASSLYSKLFTKSRLIQTVSKITRFSAANGCDLKKQKYKTFLILWGTGAWQARI